MLEVRREFYYSTLSHLILSRFLFLSLVDSCPIWNKMPRDCALSIQDLAGQGPEQPHPALKLTLLCEGGWTRGHLPTKGTFQT